MSIVLCTSQVMERKMKKKNIYQGFIKRLLDVTLSCIALVILSPVLLATAILVRVKLGSPVIFKQARPGKDEKIFQLYKFRSMTNETGPDGRLLSDEKRLTKYGRFLRGSSIDELPELFNILKGDMSIVGPRPLSIYYLPLYSSIYRRRHEVKPGLTGLAQINGRNNLQWDERFDLDIEYVDNVSFRMDLKIVMDTVLKVLKHSDIVVRGANDVKDYGPYCVMREEKQRGKGGRGLMTYSEIGSFFWLDGEEKKSSVGEINWLPFVEDSTFAFSGRNAIDLALRDILNNKSINRVLVPSYCCVSMLQSFIDRGIKIEFYNVEYKNGAFTYTVPEADARTIVIIMSYFGLDTSACHNEIKKLNKSGAVVIEDITHSLLHNDSLSEYSDYLIASLRKWFAIPTGGWVGKKHGNLSEKPTMDSNHAVEDKISGMKEKYEYLAGKINSKENFLFANATFENDLIHVDRMLKIDDTSLGIVAGTDVTSVAEQRRKNTETLLSGLQDLDGIVLTLPKVNLQVDTPLFLPIFLKTEDRDELRKQLIEKDIYCPIHWPEVMGAEEGVRANELSLICDQRYGEGDMKVIVDEIHAWYQGKV